MKRELRSGFTTGACAAAAAKAAAMILSGAETPVEVDISMPDGAVEKFRIESAAAITDEVARAVVKKFSGDDPDVTDGALVVVELQKTDGTKTEFRAGEGVGIVTKPGLSVEPGEPAINPGPRRMIKKAVAEVMSGGCVVKISIPGGAALAEKTYNPRLGIEGGLSILGTSGRVVPYSHPALREALKCSIDVAAAGGVKSPILVPGNIGRKAALAMFNVAEEEIIDVSNEWGWMLDELKSADFENYLVVGHPGKLAKLPMGEWDTHSRRSPSAADFAKGLAEKAAGLALESSVTVEGILSQLEGSALEAAANAIAEAISKAIGERTGKKIEPDVVIINMKGEPLGMSGKLKSWKLREISK